MSPAEDPLQKKRVRFAPVEHAEPDGGAEEERTRFDRDGGVTLWAKGSKSGLEQGSDAARSSGWRWMVSVALCGSFLGLGMAISVLGPTFDDLAVNVDRDISNLSSLFVGRSSGYIGGSLLGGILFDWMDSYVLLGFSLLLTAFGMSATPFCTKAWLLTLLMCGVGLSMGVLDTGGNVLILNTWGEQAGPHLQALHFSFAAGAFASPIIAKLLFGHQQNNSSLSTPLVPGHASKALSAALPHNQPMGIALTSMWAYIVIGAYVFLVSLLFFVLYFCSSPNSPRSQSAGGKQHFSPQHSSIILLLSLFFFFYVGTEVAYGSFIFTYGESYLHMEAAQAAGLNSFFWGAFAAGRFLAIFFAAFLSPGTMILLCLVGSISSSVLLCLFSRTTTVLWACTGLYGLSMSTTFPSGIAWVEQYTTVTGRSAAVFVVGAALGEMVLPAFLAYLLGHVQNHPLLMYLALCAAIANSILFPVLYRLASPGSKATSRHKQDADEHHQALLDNVEEEQWNDAGPEMLEMVED